MSLTILYTKNEYSQKKKTDKKRIKLHKTFLWDIIENIDTADAMISKTISKINLKNCS